MDDRDGGRAVLRLDLQEQSRTGTSLPQFKFRARYGEILRGVGGSGGVEGEGAGSRRSLGGMREIPEGQALDVERVRPAILQMKLDLDSSLTVDL
jgi:hypothetical protein